MDEYFEYDGLLFAWDPAKAVSNLQKHGIPFNEAATVFADRAAQMFPDPDHSVEENRFLLVGFSNKRRILVVISVERGARIRLISARKATRAERKTYEED